MKWISYSQVLPHRWAYKKDIPEQWQHWAKRVEFRWETVWIVRDDNGRVYMPDGEWTETLDFYLKTPGHVIGLRDITTADGHDWSNEWKEAMKDKILDRLKEKQK